MENVKAAHKRNLRISKTDRFVPWMITQLREFCVTTCRPHVVGDYYDAEYVQKWHDIVKRNRRIKFFSYTRSWVDPEILDPLIALGQEKNFRMWWSWDKDMPFPPRVRGFRNCYVMSDDEDQPRKRPDLVFRDKKTSIIKFTDDGAFVCPYDNGVTHLNCSHCQLCWKTKHGKIPRKRKTVAA